MEAAEIPLKICELCGTNAVESGRLCNECKSTGITEKPPADKRCNKCEIVQPLDQFHRDKGSPDGLTNTCKTCKREIDRIANIRKQAEKLAGVDKLKPVKDAPPQSTNQYMVTVDFSDCKWLLAYITNSSSLPVGLQIKRMLIDPIEPENVKRWLLTEVVK